MISVIECLILVDCFMATKCLYIHFLWFSHQPCFRQGLLNEASGMQGVWHRFGT